MRIYILTMDDPVYSVDFCRKLIDARHDEIVGMTLARFARFNLGKRRSKFEYAVTLLLIMGPLLFLQNVWKTVFFKWRLSLSKHIARMPSPSIRLHAEKYGIPVIETDNPNDESYLCELRRYNPDVIFNQCQSIVRKSLIGIPSIGVLNKHNALLPKDRGRLTPFWVLKRGDRESGVSIHFVDEGIDSGDIIVQERLPVSPGESFMSLVRKNEAAGLKALLKAFDLLSTGLYTLIPNDDSRATYNRVPTLRDAYQYRIRRIFRKKP